MVLVVTHNLAKVKLRVRFPLPAPTNAAVAHQVEQQTENLCVAGSSPARGTIFYPCRSTDRTPCYERGNGGSIPSGGTNSGDMA
jgi:hypothetical protein